jgi:hypothetical protein
MQTLYSFYLGNQLCVAEGLSNIPPNATLIQPAQVQSLAEPIRLDSTNTLKPDFLVNFNQALTKAKTQNKNLFTYQASSVFTYVDGTSFNGGPATAQSFFLLVQAAQVLGELTTVLYDTQNAPHTYTLQETQTIASQINTAYQRAFQAYQQRKAALDALSQLVNWDKNQTWDYPTKQLLLDPIGQIWQPNNAGVTGGDPTIFAVHTPPSTLQRDNTITWVCLGYPTDLIAAIFNS